MEILRGDRRDIKLPAPGQKQGFTLWEAQYLELQSSLSKKGRTRAVEKEALSRWASHLGNVRLDRILTSRIKSFIEKRLAGKLKVDGKTFGAAAPRAVQFDVIALRNCLKQAIETCHLRELPRFPKIKVPPPPRRALITPEEFNGLLAACLATGKDGPPVTENREQLRESLQASEDRERLADGVVRCPAEGNAAGVVARNVPAGKSTIGLALTQDVPSP